MYSNEQQMEKRHRMLKNENRNDQKEDYLMQKLKRAACGNMNGSPMHKWICW